MKNFLAIASAALLVACQPVDQAAPAFDGDAGQTANTGVDYPSPTGTGIGSAVPNYQFLGFPRPDVQKTELMQMQLADFYNPTNAGVWPEGSPYGAAGAAKPKALAIVLAAVWCGPCNQEAATMLPARQAMYSPGGALLLGLGESATPGDPATFDNLVAWTSRYHLDYSAVLDPSHFINNVVGIDAYPGNMIVRTRDMKIITWIAGEPDDAYWQLFEKVIAGHAVLPGDPASP
jgi:hypothetical protein